VILPAWCAENRSALLHAVEACRSCCSDWFFVPRTRRPVIALLGEILQQAAGHSVLAEFEQIQNRRLRFRQLDALCCSIAWRRPEERASTRNQSNLCLAGRLPHQQLLLLGRMRSDIRLFWPIAARGMASPLYAFKSYIN